jgi:multidrug efflux pump subunit AcrB
MEKIVNFFLDRPLVVNLIVLTLFILGLKSAMEIRKEGFPEVSFNKIIIKTIYPGSSAHDVEINVTTAIEDALKEVEGISEVLSTSMEGISLIEVQAIEDYNETEFQEVYNDIDDAINKMDDLPRDLDGKPTLKKITSKEMPVMEIALIGSYEQLKTYAPFLEKKLRKVKGVSGVDVIGHPDLEVHILVDPLKAERYGVDLKSIAGAIQKRNIEGSGGTLESFIDEKKVVSFNKFESFSAVLDTAIRMSPEGFGVRLADVAAIATQPKDMKLTVRNNGKPGMVFSIRKGAKSDIIQTVSRINEVLAKHTPPAGVESKILVDKSTFTRYRLNLLSSNAIIGFALVSILLVVFLNFKTALWTAFGIPFTLLALMIVLNGLNITLNMISLGGFIIVIGMLVDDAIVISEEINSNKEKGMPPREAASQAVAKMWRPVLGSSLTTMVAFTPIFYIGGFPGKFIWVIPLMVIFALSISLFESYFLLPAHLFHGKSYSTKKKKVVIFLENIYEKALIKVLNFKYIFFVFIMLVLLASLMIMNKVIKKDPFPQKTTEGFNLQISMAKGATLGQMEEEIKMIEKELSNLKKNELIGFSARIGTLSESSAADMGSQNNLAIIFVYLTPYSERNRTADQIIETLRPRIKNKIQRETTINSNLIRVGPPMGKQFEIRVIANDDQLRDKNIREIKKFLSSVKGIIEIEDDQVEGKDELNLLINHSILARTGLTVEDVLTTLRIAFDGFIVTDMITLDKKIDFRLRLNKKGRANVNYLKNLSIINKYGQIIKLHNFISIQEQPAKGEIRHIDNIRSVTIFGNTNSDIISPLQVMKMVQEKFKSNESVEIAFAGQPTETKKIFGDLSKASIVALLGVFIIIALIFNSLTKPIIIMATVPFIIIGIVFALFTHGEPASMFSGISMVGLIGVVVNTSIVMVHTITDLSQEAKVTREIVIQGAVSRLRPILLSMVTTVLGILPTAYGIGGFDFFLSSMSLAMAYGLMFSSIIILFLVPVFYAMGMDVGLMMDKIKLKLKKNNSTPPGALESKTH